LNRLDMPATPLRPLQTLHALAGGERVPLPPRLARLYGALRMPRAGARPYVYSNFVSSLDGVVSLNVPGHASGGDISGFSAADRMVMGVLRACADAIVIGTGTLAADRSHVWTPDAIFPSLARDFARVREALGLAAVPRNVVVSGSGRVDLALPIFASGKVPATVITTAAGAARIARGRPPAGLDVRVARGRPGGALTPRAILEAVRRASGATRILVEGGPTLLGDFYAARLVDEQFLTLAPQFVGRTAADPRLSLAMGHLFPPGHGRWAELRDARRGGDLLFLRYAFARGARRPRR
jgi:riboflavin biosynthesis pyrimidine reductase